MKDNNSETVILHVNDAKDMLNPFSLPEDGFLSDQYFSLIKFYGRRVSKKKIVLDFGENISEKDRDKVTAALHNSTVICYSEATKELRRYLIMGAWFAVSLILSILFILMVGLNADEMVVLFGGILAYFFAVRLVTIAFSKIIPLMNERKSLLFLNSLIVPRSEIVDGKTADEMIGTDEKLEMAVCAENENEIIRSTVIGDDVLITDQFANYLLKAMPLIDNQQSMELEIRGSKLSREHRERLNTSIKTYFRFGYEDTCNEIKGVKKSLAVSSIALVILSAVMYMFGYLADVTVYNIVLTVIWVLADYLLETVILSMNKLKDEKRKYGLLKDMEVTYAD